MDHADTVAVTLHGASEMAVERLGDSWSGATPCPDTAVVSPAPEPPHGRSDGVSTAAAQTVQHAMPGAGSEPLSLNALYQTLGAHLIQMLRETLDAHLTTALTQLMPQMLETVCDMVRAQMPELLEVLLQREIATLKRAAEPDQREA